MINKDRIVPIQKTDLLTMVGMVLNLIGTSYSVLASSDVEGDFTVNEDSVFLANQPVKSLDFADGVSSATVYFVADYAFTGFKVAGETATIADGSATVNPDGATLYSAELASDEVTITAISPVESD